MVDAVERDIAQIHKKMPALHALHTKRLMVTFDEQATREQDCEIELMTQNITGLFRSAERTLKRVAAAHASEAQEEDSSGGQEAVQKNIQRSMAMKLQQLSVTFRSTQKDYLSRLAQQRGASSGNSTFDFLSGDGGGGLDGGGAAGALAAVDAGFTAQQLAVVEGQESAVQERDAEIQKIARSITELSEIFKELAVLVIDQGTILDRIDFNMEQVVEHTREGIKQLEKAEEYQKSARPKWCIAFLLFSICALLVVIVLKHGKKHHNGSSHHDDDDDDDGGGDDGFFPS